MKNEKIIMSAVLLMLLSTGCVKPTEEVNNTTQNDASNPASDGTVVYTEQPSSTVYDESAPIIYGDPTTITATPPNNNVIYGTPIGGDGNVVTTDHYQPAIGSSIETGGGAYGTPAGGGGEIYNSVDDPYTTTGSNTYSNNNPYTTTSSNTNNNVNSYHTNTSYTTNSSYSGGGVQLQVAALSSYYAAQELKKGLSLDSKYSAYVKKGRMNKVIIKGFSSRAEAKALAARQFPGAFIVSGTSSSSNYSTPSYSGSTNSSYNTNSSYSSHSSASANRTSGIGIQVGAFSSKSKARSIAQSKAGGKYTAIVKTAHSRGRTIYKAIILGFSSRADAKRAIASGRFGDAFVVNIH